MILKFFKKEDIKEKIFEEADSDIESKIDSNKAEIEDLRAKRKELYAEIQRLHDEAQDNYEVREENRVKSNQIRDEIWQISSKMRDLDFENRKLEREFVFSQSQKTNELADEDDWEECFERLPNEIEYEDLEIPVEGEFERGPYANPGDPWDAARFDNWTQEGYLNKYTMTLSPTKELIAEYLKKEIKDITRKDLSLIVDYSWNNKAYYDFIYDKFLEQAKKEAKQAWDDGDIDYDEIDWKDPDDDYFDRD